METDLSIASKPSEVDAPPRSRRKIWIGVGLMVVVLIFAPVITTYGYRCAICVKRRSDARIFGFVIQQDESETECSQWYRENVEPMHQHLWVRGTYSESYSLCGVRVFISQEFDLAEGPLSFFVPTTRQMMYEQSDKPLTAKETLMRLAFWEETGTPERDLQQEVAGRLWSWQNDGFEGPPPMFPDE